VYFFSGEFGSHNQEYEAVNDFFAFGHSHDGKETILLLENDFDRKEYKEEAVVAQRSIENANGSDGGSDPRDSIGACRFGFVQGRADRKMG